MGVAPVPSVMLCPATLFSRTPYIYVCVCVCVYICNYMCMCV